MSYFSQCRRLVIILFLMSACVLSQSYEVKAQYGNTSSCEDEDVRDSSRGGTTDDPGVGASSAKQGADRITSDKQDAQRECPEQGGQDDQDGSGKQGADREGSGKQGGQRDGSSSDGIANNGDGDPIFVREESTKSGEDRENRSIFDSIQSIFGGGDESEYGENSQFSEDQESLEQAEKTAQDLNRIIGDNSRNAVVISTPYFGDVELPDILNIPSLQQRIMGVSYLSLTLFAPVFLVVLMAWFYLFKHKDVVISGLSLMVIWAVITIIKKS